MPTIGGTVPPAPTIHLSNYGTIFVCINAILILLSTLAVVFRFLSRRLTQSVGWDDGLSLGAIIFAYGNFIAGILIVTIGRSGYHLLSLNLVQFEYFLQTLLAYVLLLLCSIALSKLAILWFYWQIFRNRQFRIQIWTLTVLTLVSWLVVSCFLTFQTRPIRAQFTPWIPHEGFNPKTIYEFSYALDMILDIVILVMPLPQIWKLQMSSRKKILIALLLLLGFVTCSTSVFRFNSIARIRLEDATYSVAVPGIWTSVEIHLSIFCSCAPMLPKLFKHWYCGSRTSTAPATPKAPRTNPSRSAANPETKLWDSWYLSDAESEEHKRSVHVQTDIEIQSVERCSDDSRNLAAQYRWVPS